MSSNVNAYGRTGTGRSVGVCEGNFFKQLTCSIRHLPTNVLVSFTVLSSLSGKASPPWP